ncbi:glycerophosphodiester phosphodiesterase family protein [Mucilaginibacter sabulilitoris]|uniref:Glycerophosphodiester phosphodiesterase family protein n=1 Tax=Mucilaginibacter sabulilitoris TaxID=1173583 RepID=A0ABZ0THN9_9SPHI|nr:glycerophosphodiester phosphodiesterase family protein [Mucilaginibacter sabulilitoris]WPU92711.1 glycerophosphodiester phosphodiesterase family protein [Mucilaginibacter sabulilitoris]
MKYLLMLLISCGCFLTVKAQEFDTEGHRGGRALMPENTIPAMINGVRTGVRTLELDCQITADGKVMVSHDPVMSSNIMLKPDGSEIAKGEEKKYVLYKMPYDSIRLFQEGVKQHPDFPGQKMVKTYKPLLADLIDSVENYVKVNHLKPVYYNMETKSRPAGDNITNPVPEVFVKLLMAVITQKKIADRVIIQSFDPRTLQVLHHDWPQMKTAFLTSTGCYEENINKLGFKPTIISPEFKSVNEAMVKSAHENKVLVLPWTVNNETDMKAMADLKVDGIISDYPDRLVKLFGSYQKK